MTTPSRETKALETEKPPTHVVDFAVEVTRWSPCRSKRGVVIFKGEDIVSHGYNYKPRGFDCRQNVACKATCRIEAVHAEQQALLTAGRASEGADMLHVKTVNGSLVPSGGPSCVECSKLARVAGVEGFWLYHEDGWRRYPMSVFHTLSLANNQQLATLARLQEELTESRSDFESFAEHHAATERELATLREQVGKVLEYARHKPDCLVATDEHGKYTNCYWPLGGCTCGLDTLSSAAAQP